MRKRDLFDYVALFSGLIATGFAIYFYAERYKDTQIAKRNPKKDPKDKLGVILD